MKYLFFIIPCIFGFNVTSAQKLTDTIFYNQEWKICERPIAEYYRLGTLAVDSFWFFTGYIEDHILDDHTLIMKGDYSVDGYKNGMFEFYYPNGKLNLRGQYIHDKMRGLWNYYYPDGSPKATVYFPENIDYYIFLRFYNDKGKLTLENGTGDFSWSEDELDFIKDEIYYGYHVNGEFKDTLRTGTWKYYRTDYFSINGLKYKESYEKGRVKKITHLGYNYNEKVDKTNVHLEFAPKKIAITERIVYDEFLSKKDSTWKKNDETFISYMINGESPGITIKEKDFAKAYEKIIRTLDKHRYKIDFRDKEIEGEIEFKISDKGFPENITVTGNISEKEKRLMIYIMEKFKGIEMPTIEANKVSIEAYHKFYFFTYNTRSFLPISAWDYVPKTDFTFSAIKKDKFLEFAKTLKPVFRKIINRGR